MLMLRPLSERSEDMEKKYMIPDMEITAFEAEDVITESVVNSTPPETPEIPTGD